MRKLFLVILISRKPSDPKPSKNTSFENTCIAAQLYLSPSLSASFLSPSLLLSPSPSVSLSLSLSLSLAYRCFAQTFPPAVGEGNKMCDSCTLWSIHGQIKHLQQHPSEKAKCVTVAHFGASKARSSTSNSTPQGE